mmetsp:Transcript_934/g.2311  ORF Transcript_934/g.2311 Transcript_934/m.2311 type:complete len:310 (+) Transcript_934:35-964(+)
MATLAPAQAPPPAPLCGRNHRHLLSRRSPLQTLALRMPTLNASVLATGPCCDDESAGSVDFAGSTCPERNWSMNFMSLTWHSASARRSPSSRCKSTVWASRRAFVSACASQSTSCVCRNIAMATTVSPCGAVASSLAAGGATSCSGPNDAAGDKGGATGGVETGTDGGALACRCEQQLGLSIVTRRPRPRCARGDSFELPFSACSVCSSSPFSSASWALAIGWDTTAASVESSCRPISMQCCSNKPLRSRNNRRRVAWRRASASSSLSKLSSQPASLQVLRPRSLRTRDVAGSHSKPAETNSWLQDSSL